MNKFTFGDKVQFDNGAHNFEVSAIYKDEAGIFWYLGGIYSYVEESKLSLQVEKQSE